MALNNLEKLSKDDRLRISLLRDLSQDYLNGKERYETMPQKINSLLQMISTIGTNYEEELKKCWGQIKLIQAEAIYDKKLVLDREDKKDFDSVINEIRELSSNILATSPSEPEDPYAWPFEEYK